MGPAESATSAPTTASSTSSEQARVLSLSFMKAIQWNGRKVEPPLRQQIAIRTQLKKIPVVPSPPPPTAPSSEVLSLICNEPLEGIPTKYPKLTRLDITEFEVTYKQLAVLMLGLKHIRQIDFQMPEKLDIPVLSEDERLAILRLLSWGAAAEDEENIRLLTDSITINAETRAKLLLYAKKYGLMRLQERCESFEAEGVGAGVWIVGF